MSGYNPVTFKHIQKPWCFGAFAIILSHTYRRTACEWLNRLFFCLDWILQLLDRSCLYHRELHTLQILKQIKSYYRGMPTIWKKISHIYLVEKSKWFVLHHMALPAELFSYIRKNKIITPMGLSAGNNINYQYSYIKKLEVALEGWPPHLYSLQ